MYYEDAYTQAFTANVVAVAGLDVVLAESFFYPTSGGQPHDVGRIADIPVTNVTIREDDQAVIHTLAEPLACGTYSAEIDWPRRFDHMQQHTGQHILSQAFVQVANANTIGFHLGVERCTIDLDIKKLDPETMERVEALSNQIVWENRPINSYWVSKEEAQSLPLRKRPDVEGDSLRLVEIADFDLNACGGTHVRATGEVGLIKIVKLERIRKQVRVVFHCGKRAWRDYEAKNQLANLLSAEFTCTQAEIPNAISKLQHTLKATRKQLKQATRKLIQYEALALLADAEIVGDARVITKLWQGRDIGEIRQLANLLTKEARTVVFFAIAGSPAYLIFGRSNDASGDMNALLQIALKERNGTGGGRAHYAQGGNIQATPQQLETTLTHIKHKWHERRC